MKWETRWPELQGLPRQALLAKATKVDTTICREVKTGGDPAGGIGGKVTPLPPGSTQKHWNSGGGHTVVRMVINGKPCRALADIGSDITQLTRGYCEQ